MEKVKMVVQWVLVAVFLLCTLLWFPSLSALLFFLGAVVLLPVKQVEEFLAKIQINIVGRIAIALILFVIAFTIAPSESSKTAEKDAKENTASVSDDSNKDSGKKESKKDDNKDNNKDTKKDDNKDNNKDTNKDDNKDSKKDDNKDNKKDNNKTSDNDNAAKQIIGVWTNGSSAAIEMRYTFNEDGTWEMSSEGGDEEEGTYKIVGGKTIELKGAYGNYTFTIDNADQLTDDQGRELTRYIPDDF